MDKFRAGCSVTVTQGSMSLGGRETCATLCSVIECFVVCVCVSELLFIKLEALFIKIRRQANAHRLSRNPARQEKNTKKGPYSTEEGLSLAQSICASAYVECSAKDNTGVDVALYSILLASNKYNRRKASLFKRVLGR